MGGTIIERIKNGRVDFVGIGDSNQILNGHGWDHGMQHALYAAFPMYATELMSVYEADNTGTGRGYRYGRVSAVYQTFDNTPMELRRWNHRPLAGLDGGYFPAGWTFTTGGIISSGADGTLPLGLEEALQYDVYHAALGLDSVGGFQMTARLGASPFTQYAISDKKSNNFDAIGNSVRKESLAIPAVAGRASIDCRVGRAGTSTSVTGPFYITYHRIQNPGRKAGVCYHSLVYAGGNSLLDMYTKLADATDEALTHWFEILRNDQGDTKTIVMVVNSGLNDRNEVDPSALNGYLPGDSAEAFTDNLAAIVARIEHIWAINGWNKEEMHWMFMVSHPVAEPDSAELIAYRAALNSYATDKLRCQVIDLSELTDYTEMAANDWYLTVSDQNHLKQTGYEVLSERIVAAIDLQAGNSIMWGVPVACAAPLPLSAQPCKSHALPIGTGKITVFPGVASQAQIAEAK